MKISAYADMSLRALLVLASLGPDDQLSAREISIAVNVPFSHVSKAMSALNRAGFLNVTKGRYGGAKLSEAGWAATAGQVLRAIEPRSEVVDCASEQGDCPLIVNCTLRHALANAREAFLRELDPVRLADLPSTAQMDPVFRTISRRPGLS